MSRTHRARILVTSPGNPGLYIPNGAPDGWDGVGVVTAATVTGALVRNRATGVYCICVGRALSSLPQSKVVAALAAHGH